MMLKVIASGSAGNAYILDDEKGNKLLLECGVRHPRIQGALNYDYSGLLGCLLSHEHKDHSMAITGVLTSGVDCYMSEGTARALDRRSHRLHIVESEKPFTIAPYIIKPFNTQHDAAQPLGFLIKHMETSEMLIFATDTHYIKYKFSGVNYFLIECNYCDDLLQSNIDAGMVENTRVKRLQRSHFALSRVIKFLRASVSIETSKVVLLHLSDDNSDETRMIESISNVVSCSVEAARAGANIALKRIPY